MQRIETDRDVRLKFAQTPNEGDIGLLVLLCNQLMGQQFWEHTRSLSLGETTKSIHTNASGAGTRIFV